MRLGLPVSFVLHAGVLLWALVSFAATPPFKIPDPDPVEVAIITEDGLTRLTQGDRNAKKLEAAPAPPAPDSNVKKTTKRAKLPEPAAPPEPASPPPEPAKADPPPPEPPTPEPVKAEPPPPDPIAEKLAMLPPEPKGPSPEELKRIEEQKKAAERKQVEEEKKRKAAEAKKKLEQKKRRELKKKKREEKRLADLKRRRDAEKKKRQNKQDDFFADMQKALKDNDPNKKPPPPGGSQIASDARQRGPRAGAPEGRDTRLTASQNSMLGLLIKDAVRQCWNINSGAQGVEKIQVKLIVRLRPDGSLAEPPRLYNSMPGPLFADTANSAVRAVLKCASENRFRFPPELYKGGWERAIWTFDPSKMF